MNPTADASYREAASTLRPQAVSEYLAVSPWNLERRDDIKEIWQLRSATGESLGRLMLPLATNYIDFADRFYDAILTLSRVNDWDANQLLEQILATRADLFFVRLDQSTADGTIPFKQAETTIEAIYNMVRSAAARAAGSRATRKGKLPAAAQNFLDDDVRLGHTKRGSFVFTVAARLNGRITANQSLADINAEAFSGTVFSRHVMEVLARSLEATRNIVSHEARTLEDFLNFGANLDLMEPLEEIAKPEGLRSVELSFQWAMAIPRPAFGTEPIRLDHRDASILSELRERQAVEEVAAKPTLRIINHVTLEGPVIALVRADSEEEDSQSDEVIIIADVGGSRLREVHAPLSGQDHDRAIQAFRSRLPLTISGDLVYEGRIWRLTGNVEFYSR